MESEERSDCGQVSGAPSGVADQSCARIRAAVSPPLARKPGSARALASTSTHITPLRWNRTQRQKILLRLRAAPPRRCHRAQQIMLQRSAQEDEWNKDRRGKGKE